MISETEHFMFSLALDSSHKILNCVRREFHTIHTPETIFSMNIVISDACSELLRKGLIKNMIYIYIVLSFHIAVIMMIKQH